MVHGNRKGHYSRAHMLRPLSHPRFYLESHCHLYTFWTRSSLQHLSNAGSKRLARGSKAVSSGAMKYRRAASTHPTKPSFSFNAFVAFVMSIAFTRRSMLPESLDALDMHQNAS